MSGSSDQRYRSVIKCTTDTKLSSKFIVESFADEFASLDSWCWNKKITSVPFPLNKDWESSIQHSPCEKSIMRIQILWPWDVDHFKWKDKKITPQKVVVFLYEVIMHHYWPQEYLPGTLHNQFKMDVWWFPSISFVKVWFIIQLKTTISNWMFRIPWNLLHHF